MSRMCGLSLLMRKDRKPELLELFTSFWDQSKTETKVKANSRDRVVTRLNVQSTTRFSQRHAHHREQLRHVNV